VTCVDKANVFKSMAFFRRIFDEVGEAYPEIERDYAYVDALSMYLVQRPASYDVLVTENMYGDIISDLAAGLVGGLGMAPSGDIGEDSAVFQPSHGTAPDIAGQGLANPLATILSAGLMLRWLGDRNDDPAATQGADRIEAAVRGVIAEVGVGTPDLGGKMSTGELGDTIVQAL
jgi:3-isopropylmalate dehydrogenase